MKPSPRRWLMISLVFWATVINYLDRQTLSVAAPVLRDQFHMSNEAYSRILFAFLLAYTIMNGLSGPIIDKLGTRLGYALSMAWWSASALLHGLARGPFSLGVFRFLLAMGEAGNWPAGVKVVSEWFPENERALASGLFNSGTAVGAILAPPIVAFILLRLGWQAAFVFVGISGFIWLAFWMPTYRSPHEIPGNPAAVEPLMPMRDLIRTRFVATFTFSKAFMDPVWYFYTFWFPEYLRRIRHFDMAAIGIYAWIPFAVAGLGSILGGWLSGFLLARGATVTVARKLAVTLFALLMTSAIPAVLTPSAALSIAFVSLAMMGYTGALASMLAMPADTLPANRAGSAYGIASMGSGLGGMIFTLITGWAVDRYSYTPVFFGFAILPLICATILWTLMGPLTKPAPVS